MKLIFYDCKELEYLDLTNWNTSKVVNMDSLFCGCTKLKEIKGIDKFNTINITNMNDMFINCENLEYLDLSNFNTSNITYIDCMFYECHKLKKIKGIKNFNIDNVTNMYGMFYECKELEYLDLSNFNISKAISFEILFGFCYKLKKIYGINNFKTDSANNKRVMFANCKELEYLDLSNFNTSHVPNFEYMFNG